MIKNIVRNNLLIRFGTALVVIPIVVGIFFINEKFIYLFLFLIGLGVAKELSQMSLCKKFQCYIRYVFVPLFLPILVVILWINVSNSLEIVLALLTVIAVLIMSIIFLPGEKFLPKSKKHIYIYANFFGISVAFIPLLIQLPDGIIYVLFLLAVVWASDSGSYFVGTFFGKKKLAPHISPSKTFEGAIGALLFGFGMSLTFYKIFPLPLSLTQVIVLGIFIPICAIFGDLFESMLKRKSNVKDSGRLFPGHGGILDRMDSLVPNFPLVYVISTGVLP
jgi:phosphatidate cytidylyltransferase